VYGLKKTAFERNRGCLRTLFRSNSCERERWIGVYFAAKGGGNTLKKTA
jgi:hypothetical protein